MNERVVRDLSGLPQYKTGSGNLAHWGDLAYMLIEGAGLAIAVCVYLYLASIAPHWPIRAAPPDLPAGTISTVVYLISLVPNHLVKRWAADQDLRKTRLGLVVMSLLGLAPLILRIFEFRSLNVYWDDNAYGSVVYLLIGLHTTHLFTDWGETLVLTGAMWTRHGANPRRFSDIEDNAFYWAFVVVTWLPIYACLYWVPRWTS